MNINLKDICPVVLCGGEGTRLWPLSRSLYPKQFLPLTGEHTLLQGTFLRFASFNNVKPITICNEEHRFIVAEQLRELNVRTNILLEPEGRNTAPAIASAAIVVLEQACGGEFNAADPLMLVLPADHIIQSKEAFEEAVTRAIPLAEAGKLVTFGIVPDSPHTGYGYIRKGKDLQGAFKVDRFVEKPDEERAQCYLDSGDYYWNSGMFLFRASRYIEELRAQRPAILDACEAALKGSEKDSDFLRLDYESFVSCPSESVDYAVMENTEDAVVVPLDAGWNDIGSWSAIWEVNDKDSCGNSTQGDCIMEDTRDTLIHGSDRLVATIGIEDLIIVDTKDAVMVAHKSKVQQVKKIVSKLKSEERSEWKLHREVNRPWGKYDSIDCGERYQVKRITVNPGAKLSVQMHHHRAEHWIVVSGTARVTNGDSTFLVTENESTYIPLGAVHALENPGMVPLEMIEVQSGSYLGEDDIVRFEDRYGRLEK